MIRVLIADDHAIVRKGLKQIVSETSDITVADEASDGAEVLDKVKNNDYDVIVLDVSMPVRSGLEVLQQLRQLKPGLPVIILSMHPEEQFAVRMLKSGASSYLSKESAPDELVKAIRHVYKGNKYITSKVADKLVSDLEIDSEKLPHERLTEREFQVMLIIASGKSVKETAAELCLSVKTVSTYRTRILEKMKMRSNAQFTQYAIRHKLIE
jgi:DNA-binding NarL/FixJ family response regulator